LQTDEWRKPSIFQTMNSIRPNYPSLKYNRFILSGWKDIGIKKFKFVTKTPFLCKFEKIDIFFSKSSYIVKMIEKKCPQVIKYKFLKSPWPCHLKYAKMSA